MKKTLFPLILMSIFFVLAFFDGMFMWGLTDGFYMFAGFTFMVSLVWMWIIELTK